MAYRRRRRFTAEFKLMAVERMARSENIRGLARDLDVERKLLYLWRDTFLRDGAAGLRCAGRPLGHARLQAVMGVVEVPPPPADETARIASLERKIGEQQLALDFFRAALRHVRDQRLSNGVSGTTAFTR